jgi:hypothetical protein
MCKPSSAPSRLSEICSVHGTPLLFSTEYPNLYDDRET